MRTVRLSLGPLLYYWPRERVELFYDEARSAPVDIVYLGEVVCGKRHELKLADWMAIARRLADAGKEVVLSTLALPESETDLRVLRRIVANGEFAVEANDMGAVRLAAGAGVPFVIGLHVNAYNPAVVHYLRAHGAVRWVAPVELSASALGEVTRGLSIEPMPVEVFAYGRVPLAFSARCFTARAQHLGKDDCRFVCAEDPDGLVINTLDNVPALALNGVQAQSARPYCLASALSDVMASPVDVLRVSPTSRHTWDVVQTFRACLDGEIAPAHAVTRIHDITGAIASNGYWRGKAGMDVPALH